MSMSITINFAAIITFISSPVGHFILAVLSVPIIFAISSLWFRFIRKLFKIFFNYKVEDYLDNMPIVFITIISLVILTIYFLKLFIFAA